MELYIWIWAISLLLSLLPKKAKVLYMIWGVILVVIAGTRDIEVGTDTRSYNDIFETVGNGTYAPWVEPGWNFVCFTIYSIISKSYNTFLLLIAAITFFNYFYVFYKDSPYPFLSVFIFISLHIYTGSFNIMRQYLAMSFLILSWHLYYNHKKLKSIIPLLISFFFHYSTFFSIVSYLWNKLSLSSSKIVSILVVSFIIGSIMNESILTIFTGSSYAKFLATDTVFRENSMIMILMVLAQNALTFIVVILTKGELKDDFWFKLFVLSCVIFNLTYMVAYAARFYYVFSISQIVYIPLFMKKLKKSYKFTAYAVLLIYMSAQFFRILIPNGNGIIPYNSYLIQ